MIASQITQVVLEWPEDERLELARKLVESISPPEDPQGLIAGGIHRIEDIVSGKVKGLTEEEFRRALE